MKRKNIHSNKRESDAANWSAKCNWECKVLSKDEMNKICGSAGEGGSIGSIIGQLQPGIAKLWHQLQQQG